MGQFAKYVPSISAREHGVGQLTTNWRRRAKTYSMLRGPIWSVVNVRMARVNYIQQNDFHAAISLCSFLLSIDLGTR